MSNSPANHKPVIAIAVFGSTSPDGHKNLEDVDFAVRKRYPDHEVRWAFTSDFIINRLRQAGRDVIFERKVRIRNTAELYADMAAEGKKRVVVQPLLVMTGDEYSGVLETPAPGLDVEYGYPLLAPPDNVERVVRALEGTFGKNGTATVICSHGNKKSFGYNAPLLLMDRFVRKNYRNIFLATLDGPPGTGDAFASVRQSGCSSVRFVPLLIVAGEHISRDIMGDGPNTYKSQLGLPAAAEDGLGSNKAVMDIWMESIDWALRRLEG